MKSNLNQTKRKPLLSMTWEYLLFMHWSVNKHIIQDRLPSPLKVDTFQGQAYLGIVPFLMTNIAFSRLPKLTKLAFPELNLRTYVTYNGKPGIYFFHLDANNILANQIARSFFKLNYVHASIDVNHPNDTNKFVDFSHRRKHSKAEFSAAYRPVSEPFLSSEQLFAAWSTERYRFFSSNGKGKIYQGDIAHEPWHLQKADVEVRSNSIIDAAGFPLSPQPAHVLYGHSINVAATKFSRLL
ncbi:YqjF family protein [Salipaludibacillus daqingensis]|uniref:YqjF family protein n=1 Tax=Salipaludibacillus daqingensis TaxID=3041001 RepID=UPI002474C178|nr:DUF2071 domain-containing protein [Salipaludibacillus daqingensis]